MQFIAVATNCLAEDGESKTLLRGSSSCLEKLELFEEVSIMLFKVEAQILPVKKRAR